MRLGPWDIFILWKINSGLVWAAGPVREKRGIRFFHVLVFFIG